MGRFWSYWESLVVPNDVLCPPGLGFSGADHSGPRPEVEDAGSDRMTEKVSAPPHPEVRDSPQNALTLQVRFGLLLGLHDSKAKPCLYVRVLQ